MPNLYDSEDVDVQAKHVHIDYVMERKNYWYPYKNRKIHFHTET